MTDIPVTIPSDEMFRTGAMQVLWTRTHVSYSELLMGSSDRARVDRVAQALRDSYIRGAHDTTVHYEDRVEVAEAPKDRTWIVTCPLGQGQGYRTVVVQSPDWAVAQEGELAFGTMDVAKEMMNKTVAIFADGQWSSVVLQVENNVPVVGS